MRRIAWFLLLLFAFTIPWEYSLDLGAPWGNIARIVGLMLLLAAVPAVLQAGLMRPPGAMQWLVLSFYVWFCLTYFWTADPVATLAKLRGYPQELMVVWLVWEFASSAEDLRWLLRGFVLGCWVLAVLTLANLASPQAIAEGQIRFAATGQDPNDVARFLDLGFPLAALLLGCERKWPARMLALGYLPLGFVSVLLTASRGGFLAALVGLAGSGVVLARAFPRRAAWSLFALPPLAGVLWLAVPRETFARLGTIVEQLQSGGLNQRFNIWAAGWHAFARAPWAGWGAGTFVQAAGLAAGDTAHNTALTIAVTGGLVALLLAAAIVAVAARAIYRSARPVRLALATALAVWLVTSLVSTVEESRTTWLLLALIALAGRLSAESHAGMSLFAPVEAKQTGPVL